MDEKTGTPIAKWMRVLMGMGITNIINTVLAPIPAFPVVVTAWISWGTVLVAIICMFQLAPANSRYLRAGLFLAVMLACSLASWFLIGGYLITLIISAFSLLAAYYEYNAHAHIVAPADPRLSKKWKDLFLWGIVAELLTGISIVVVTQFSALTRINAVWVTVIYVVVQNVYLLVIDVVYVLYLKQTLSCIQENEEVPKDESGF